MSAVTELVIARITDHNSPSYEGWRPDVYDDATGTPIVCQGQPTVGYGSRVRDWSQARALNDTRFMLEEFSTEIQAMPWYRGTDVQKSVLLEIAFNQGYHGLLRYPHMLAYCAMDNFTAAADECTIGDTRLKRRYDALADLMRKG